MAIHNSIFGKNKWLKNALECYTKYKNGYLIGTLVFKIVLYRNLKLLKCGSLGISHEYSKWKCYIILKIKLLRHNFTQLLS